MKVGDLVQVLPARIGYYIVVGKTDRSKDGSSVDGPLWDLKGLCGTSFGQGAGGPMGANFIEVVNESR